jgi:hypothetical protein
MQVLYSVKKALSIAAFMGEDEVQRLQQIAGVRETV